MSSKSPTKYRNIICTHLYNFTYTAMLSIWMRVATVINVYIGGFGFLAVYSRNSILFQYRATNESRPWNRYERAFKFIGFKMLWTKVWSKVSVFSSPNHCLLEIYEDQYSWNSQEHSNNQPPHIYKAFCLEKDRTMSIAENCSVYVSRIFFFL